jgi:NADPH:quinone reductase-like Zn-dependent oxidoreductase
MRRRTRFLLAIPLVLAAAAGALAFAISRDGACTAPFAPAAGVPTMRAYERGCYGGPEVLRLLEVAKPVPADSEVLVRVHTGSANPLDWHELRGKPYVMRLASGIGTPKDARLGVDFAGTVEAVGRHVTRFAVGDPVFGGASGAFGDYVTVREGGAIARKPATVPFEQAAGVGIAGVTALQAVRDLARVTKGQRVLVNGASGGVGTFVVQLARHHGAHVTGVSSTRNVELVRGLGADSVIDYTKDDFTAGAARFDAIIDMVGNHPLSALERVLAPGGVVVIVGGSSDNAWIGPLTTFAASLVRGPFSAFRFERLLASMGRADIEQLAALLESGAVRTVVDRRYPLEQLPEAIAYLEGGRARGRVLVTVVADSASP